MKDLIEMLERAHKLDNATRSTLLNESVDRAAVKNRISELIGKQDWSKWNDVIEQQDVTQPEIKRTKTLPNGIRVDVYLGWDYGSKLGYKEYEAQVARPKFDALAEIVKQNEPSWSVKFTKSYGSRGASWTNYWAQITVAADSERDHLAESAKEDAVKKLKDAASSVKCRLTLGFKRYALESPDYIDNVIEDELLYCGQALCKEFPNMKYWKFGENKKLSDMYGNYCVVETGTDEGKILVQLDGHGRIYHLEESLHEATISETVYEDWDDVFCALEHVVEKCTIFGKHPYWFDAYIEPDKMILDIGVDDDDTGRTGSHYEATLSNIAEVPTNTNELIKYLETLPWKANGETDVDDEYDDIDVDEVFKRALNALEDEDN